MGNRIYFEKFAGEEDYHYFLDLVLNEKVMKMNYGRIFTPEESEQVYKATLMQGKNHEDFGQFKVFEASTNNYIGTGNIYVNDEVTEAEIEYMLLPEYWGKGYGSEIAGDLMKKAEETGSIKQVMAYTDPENKGSKAILLKNGFESVKVFKTEDGSMAEMFKKIIL